MGTVVLAAALLAACSDDLGGGEQTATPGPTTTPTTTAVAAPADSTSSTCSADASTSEPTPQPALPPSVADMRASIVEAATHCDYRELARLAMAGDTTFTYSFGDHGDPAEFWRRLESRGEPVLSILVELLERPFSTRTVGGTTQYLWPSAYGYESWSDVPKAEQEVLRPLYSDEDLRRFEQFGSYAGYRVGIVPGDWIFFVAGD